MSSDEHPSFLVVIVDGKSSAWKNQEKLASDLKRNHLLIISRRSTSSATIFPSGESGSRSSDFVPSPSEVSRCVVEGLFDDPTPHSDTTSSSDVTHSSSMSQAFSKALCVLNRCLSEKPQLQCRILAAQISSDSADTYNQMMNAIFSAQKLGVLIDSLVLSAGESAFMQQASLITGGVYQRPKDQRALTQLLLHHYLPSARTRTLLTSPAQRNVDFRASCFCHQTPVEFAYMCSVCLALTCAVATNQTCATCGSKRSHTGDSVTHT